MYSKSFFHNSNFLSLFFFLFLFSLNSYSQDLKFNVEIITDQLQVDQQKTNVQIYPTLKSTITSFLNNRKWSNDEYQKGEEIEAIMQIILTKADAQGNFQANVQLQVFRPVYGTDYQTQILNYIDKDFIFSYQLGMPLTYNDNNFIDNLTSTLAFYANLVCVYSYDSFSELGGNPYVQKINNIVNLAVTSGKGWGSATDIRSRAGINENLLNQQLQGFRKNFYQYHRLYLDQFVNKPDAMREGLVKIFNEMRETNASRPGSAYLRLFFESKSNEIISIMEEATPTVRQQAFAQLSNLDPTNTEKYRALVK